MIPRLLPAALAVAALALAACGSSSSGAATSAVPTTAIPSPSFTADPVVFCRAAASLASIPRQATSAAQAASELSGLAVAVRGTAPQEMRTQGDAFAQGLDIIATGISDGSLDGTTAGQAITTLTSGPEVLAIAKYCASLVVSAKPSASAS